MASQIGPTHSATTIGETDRKKSGPEKGAFGKPKAVPSKPFSSFRPVSLDPSRVSAAPKPSQKRPSESDSGGTPPKKDKKSGGSWSFSPAAIDRIKSAPPRDVDSQENKTTVHLSASFAAKPANVRSPAQDSAKKGGSFTFGSQMPDAGSSVSTLDRMGWAPPSDLAEVPSQGSSSRSAVFPSPSEKSRKKGLSGIFSFLRPKVSSASSPPTPKAEEEEDPEREDPEQPGTPRSSLKDPFSPSLDRPSSAPPKSMERPASRGSASLGSQIRTSEDDEKGGPIVKLRKQTTELNQRLEIAFAGLSLAKKASVATALLTASNNRGKFRDKEAAKILRQHQVLNEEGQLYCQEEGLFKPWETIVRFAEKQLSGEPRQELSPKSKQRPPQ